MSAVKSKLKGRDPQTVEPSKPKIVVFGPSGIGKTWFALDFPSVYYIDTEAGADLGHYRAKLKAAGKSRQGAPVRTIHSTPSTNIRLSRPVEPRLCGPPMIWPDIRSHCASLKISRSKTPMAASAKAAMNLIRPKKGIPRVHTT